MDHRMDGQVDDNLTGHEMTVSKAYRVQCKYVLNVVTVDTVRTTITFYWQSIVR